MIKQLHLAALVCLLIPCSMVSADPDLAGYWQFNNASNIGEATVGSDLILNNANSTIISIAGILGTDLAASVGVGDSFSLNHGIAPNGGSSAYVNEYTVVYDLYLPSSTEDTWRSLLQTTNTPDGNDGDLWFAPDDTVGVGSIGYSTQTAPSEEWIRLVFSADIGTAGSSFFTSLTDSNGNNWTFDHLEQGLDGRHSLYSTANDNIMHFFSDNNGEDAEIHVTNLALFSRSLTKSEALRLGTAGSAVPEPTSLGVIAVGFVATVMRRRRV